MKSHLYFIGIAGHAMRGLALAARDQGYQVSGLDETAVAPGSDWLDEQKLTWSRSFAPEQLEGVTAVIITGAHVSDEYPAIVEARRRHIAIQSYAEFVGELTRGKHVVAVAGTHGKTTTTSLIAWLLESAGRRPDFLVGIRPFNFPSSVRLTGADTVVVEGDEYKASSLDTRSKVQYYHPDVLVLTSAEHDHPDMYPDLAAVTDRFKEVVRAIPKAGRLVAWSGSPTVMDVAETAVCPVATYGLDEGDYVARDISYLPTGLEFDIETPNGILGRIAVPVYGRHNVLNVLAAVAVALGEGLSWSEILAGAAKFKGAYRRFNVLTPPDAAITVIDDYAHHPTEVATNLQALKLHFPQHRGVAVFRPHTYSRTAALLKEYQQTFAKADLAYVTDIEGAREQGKAHTVSGRDIVAGLTIPAIYISDRTDLVRRIALDARPGDVVLCMTVSGYDQLAEDLAKRLNQPKSTEK